MLSPGDKFVVYPGEAGSDLASISDITDYSMRFMTKDSPAPEDEEEEIVEKEIEEEEEEVPAISLIPALLSIGLIAILKRRY